MEGTVHKLCRLDRKGVKNLKSQILQIKKTTKCEGGGQNPRFLEAIVYGRPLRCKHANSCLVARQKTFSIMLLNDAEDD